MRGDATTLIAQETAMRRTLALALLVLFALVCAGFRQAGLAADSPTSQVTPGAPLAGHDFHMSAIQLERLAAERLSRRELPAPWEQRARSATGRLLWVDLAAAPGGDGTAEHPFQTIQQGLDAAVADPGLQRGLHALRVDLAQWPL